MSVVAMLEGSEAADRASTLTALGIARRLARRHRVAPERLIYEQRRLLSSCRGDLE